MKNSTKTLDEAYNYCKNLTLKADSNFALSFRFLPREKQNAIYTVYAFNRCADDFADEISDVKESRGKLVKWEHMLNECYRGSPGSHPVMIAFAEVIERFQIPKKPFLDAIAGFKMDLSVNRFNSFDELQNYCDLVAGTISIISLHIFGYLDKDAFEYGKNLSYALQLTNIIRDVGKDLQKNRIYLPLDEISKFKYSEEELLSLKENENFFNLMQFQVERASKYFKNANPIINLIPRDARFTVVMIGAVYYRLLQKIVERRIPVLKSVIQLSGWEKFKITAKMRIKPSIG